VRVKKMDAVLATPLHSHDFGELFVVRTGAVIHCVNGREIVLRAPAVTALALSFLLGPWLIRRLRAWRVGQQVRDDGPRTHLAKAGTPTMGGLLILAAIIVAWGLPANLSTH
jgi:hypothetical protein